MENELNSWQEGDPCPECGGTHRERVHVVRFQYCDENNAWMFTDPILALICEDKYDQFEKLDEHECLRQNISVKEFRYIFKSEPCAKAFVNGLFTGRWIGFSPDHVKDDLVDKLIEESARGEE